MSKFAMQIETAHAVLFLTDASPKVSIPPDVSVAPVTTTDDCIAFWVLPYVEGVSLVTISDEACDTEGLKLFSGWLHTPSGAVTLTDSSAFRYLNAPVPEDRVSVELWVDSTPHPEWVWIQLGEIRPIF